MNYAENAVVFLPGWGFKATVWQSVIKTLKRNNTIVKDLPLITPQIAASSNPLYTLAESLHQTLPDQSTLVAWSLSGLVALYLCYSYPQHYKKLILVNSAPKFLGDDNWPGISLKFKKQFMYKINDQFTQGIKYFIKLIQYPYIEVNNTHYLHAHLLEKTHPASFSLLCYLNLLFNSDLRSYYRELTLPVYCLLSENDAILPALQKGRLENLNAHHEVMIIREAGHAAFLTHPTSFMHQLNAIIQ